jgi:thymidylate synthase (FAD)
MKEAGINKIAAESVLTDVMEGSRRWEIPVLDHGFLALVDVMPRLVPAGQTADSAIVQAARVSYGEGTKKQSEDRTLIRYLIRHRHTSPFEMVELKFHAALPLFVARQWIRHRTANVNEYSGRYSVMPDRFFRPDRASVRAQSPENRQGRSDDTDEKTAVEFEAFLTAGESLYKAYENLLGQGLARELGRIGLPQNLYTEWYWKCDLHNVLHFLELRLAAEAQYEIRVYAQAMLQLVKRLAPLTVEAFEDYRLSAVTLSRLEVEAIIGGTSINTDNSREQREWEIKRDRLGIRRTKPDQ